MKKIVLFISALIAVTSSFAQIDTIPNANFNSWIGNTPAYWGTDSAAYAAYGGSSGVSKGTSPTAIVLTTQSVLTTPLPATVVSNGTFAITNTAVTYTAGTTYTGGFPYRLRPDSFTYVSKYTAGGAGDAPLVRIILTKWVPVKSSCSAPTHAGTLAGHRDTLGITTSVTASANYARTMVAISYSNYNSILNYVQGAVAPDTAQIVLFSSNPSGTPVIGSVFSVDSLAFTYPCQLNPAIVSTGNSSTGLPLFSDTLTGVAGQPFSQTYTMYIPNVITSSAGNAYIDSIQINTSCLSVVNTTDGTLSGFTVTGGEVSGNSSSNGQFPSNSIACFTISGTIPSTPANATYKLSITPNLSGCLPILGATVNYPSNPDTVLIKVGNAGSNNGNGGTVLLTVVTDSISAITGTTAAGYVTVSSNGGNPSTSGICYSTSPNPTIGNAASGETFSITGPFYSTMYHLTPNTTYYARGFATNSAGTAYGSQLQFTTGNVAIPTVTTDSINNITTTSVTGYGDVTNDGNDPTVSSGFCYSTSSNPTIADSVLSMVGSSGPFFDSLYSLLTPSTTYYIRAYATNVTGTSYGSQLQFTTGNPTLPIVTTDSIPNITATAAAVYGNLTNNGGTPNITAGFCYNTSPNPTILDSTASFSDNDTGSYSGNILPLIPNTTYYVRAYATNTAGTSYGSQLQFTTGNATLVTITTDSVNSITGATAVVYGTVTSDGNDPLATGGFCYNTSPNPTIANDTVIGNGGAATSLDSAVIGSGSITLSGLSLNTTYYVRAFATNAAGTSYGSQLQFTTGDCYAYYTTTYDTVQNTFTLTVNPTTTAAAKSYFWNFGDGSTSTNAAPTHTFTVDTTYNVCLTITGASGDSCSYCHIIGKGSNGNIYRSSGFNLVVVNKSLETGISEYNTATITVYPNPSGGIIYLNIGQIEDVMVNVYNILGESIYQHTITSSIFQIDLSAQPNGVYFIKLNTPQGIVTKKVVISK